MQIPDGNNRSKAAELYKLGKYKDAYDIYIQLAEENDSECQLFVGWLYCIGRGVEKSLQKACYWFERAIGIGRVDGYWYIGTVKAALKEYGEAALLYKKAADLGYTHANYDLGILYYHGLGVKKDLEQAYSLYLLAEKAGCLMAGRARAGMLIKDRKGVHDNIRGVLLLIKISTLLLFSIIKDPHRYDDGTYKVVE